MNEWWMSNKRKVYKGVGALLLLIIVVNGARFGYGYSQAVANDNYTQKELQKLALTKVDGKVVDSEKELHARAGEYVYRFDIKSDDLTVTSVFLSARTGGLAQMGHGRGGHHGHDGPKHEQRH